MSAPQRPPPHLQPLSRAELAAYFRQSWSLTEWLFDALDPDAFTLQPNRLRQPLIFYFGHVAAFYRNKLRLAGLLPGSERPAWDALFAVGVDPERPEDLGGGEAWPTAPAVAAYRAGCFNAVADLIDHLPEAVAIDERHPLWALIMAIEHERIHFETSSVLLRELSLRWLRPPPDLRTGSESAPDPRAGWIDVPAARVQLGRPRQDPRFGWDQEYGQRAVEVPAFAVQSHLLTNRALYAFFQEGGYQHRELWTTPGWDWRQRTGTAAPHFFRVEGGGRPRLRTLFHELPLPLHW